MTQTMSAAPTESNPKPADSPHETAPALEVHNLNAHYGKRQVLFDVSLDVRPGEVVAVLGHNGAGKTTLLRTILGLVAQRSGRVSYLGRPIERVAYYRNVAAGIAYMPAEMSVFRPLDVETNLRLGAYTQASADLEAVWRAFPQLTTRRGQLAGTLSGGEQRMLAVGMALAARPKVMLLDEPSIGLSPAVAQQILTEVARLCREQGIAVLLVDQNVRGTLRVSHRVYYLRMGRVLLTEDASAALKREHYWNLF
jgi:branched-chain amino acid transport system ATP-binding protein